MKIGTTAFSSSVDRVAKAANPMPKKKLEHGRVMSETLWTAIMRIIFSVEDSCLYLFSTNGSVFAYDRVIVDLEEKDNEDFTIYVYPSIISDYLSFSSGLVDLYKYKDGARLVIDGKQKFYLKSQSDVSNFFEGYGKVADLSDENAVLVNAILLKDVLDFTTYVANGKDILENKVLLIENVGGYIFFGATDSWRLAIAKNVVSTNKPIRSIVYREHANIFNRMIEKEEDEIQLFFEDNAIYFKDCSFVAGALLAQRAHDIWRLLDKFPEGNKIVFSPDVSLFRNSLSVASMFAEDGAGHVSLDIKDGEGTLSGVGDIGDTQWIIESKEKSSEDMRVLFNPSALQEFLAHSRTKNMTINFSAPNNPFFVTGDNPDNVLIVMPIAQHEQLN